MIEVGDSVIEKLTVSSPETVELPENGPSVIVLGVDDWTLKFTKSDFCVVKEISTGIKYSLGIVKRNL